MQTSSDSEELRLEEWPRRTDSAAVAHSRPWLWLAAAVALLPFANGANNIPLTAWLAPVFSAAICAQESPKVGLLAAYILLVAAFAFQFQRDGANPRNGILRFSVWRGSSVGSAVCG